MNRHPIPAPLRIKTILVAALLLTGIAGRGQDYQSRFIEYFDEGDTVKQYEVLEEWNSNDPQDPELYTSYFNYYFLKARNEILTLTSEEPEGESLSFQDSTGSTAGYIGSQITYDPQLLNKAFEKIDRGITLHPDRLDMRFGKIHVLGLTEDWEGFTGEIVNTVEYSTKNQNRWKWTNDEKGPGEEDFLSSLQDYQLTLYQTGDDALLTNMRTIAEEILKYYPAHIESLSNLSITYLLTGDYDQGIEILRKAEKINPEDGIILSNIAHGYRQKGDSENAIRYYRKMLNLEDPEAVEFAKQQISELTE